MEHEIQKILSELYTLDPKLRAREAEILEIIQRMRAAKPDTRLNERFTRQLRAQLLGQQKSSLTFFSFFMRNQKIGYAAAGIGLATLLIVPAVYFGLQKSGSTFAPAGQQIALLGDNAFGSLTDTQGIGTAEAPTAEFARTQSGGGGLGSSASIGLTDDASKMIIEPDIMPWPAYHFNFEYRGEELGLEQEKMEVVRRLPESLNSGVSQNLGLGLLDLGRLGSLQVQNISLQQSGEDGFQVYVDALSGTISLHRNTPFIDKPYVEQRLENVSQLPESAGLIETARRFVAEYGINLEGYGEPFVQEIEQFRIMATQPGIELYLPNLLTVLFPLEINGVPVYDQGANPDGLRVAIDINSRQVTSVQNIMTQRYQASAYTVNTNIKELLDLQQQRDWYAPSEGSQVQEVTIPLGTPELVLVKIYRYTQDSAEELFVPAFRFPVLEKPADHPYYSDAIIVPLVPELLNYDLPVRAMPAQTEPFIQTDEPIAAPAPEILETE